MQEELEKGNSKVKRVDRKFNASDMLTHSPSADELRTEKITMQSRRC